MSDKFRYTAGLNNVGSYQVSGKTFITASTVNDGEEDQIEFPDVTNNIKVKLDSASTVTKNGYKLNGEFVTISNPNVSFSSDYTIIAWIKTEYTGGGVKVLFSSQKLRLYYTGNTNTLTLRVWDESVANPLSDTVVYDLSNGFNHIAVAYNHDNNVVLYINGNPLITIDLSSNNRHTSNIQFFIGDLNTNMLHSIIEAAVFQTQFNSTNISEAYNNGSYFDLKTHSLSSDLLHYWTFGDDPGDTFNNNGGGVITATVTDTVGSIPLIANYADANDEIIQFQHSFTGGGGLRIHYRSKDRPNVISQKHYWTLDSQYESIKMNVKSKELYLSADGGNCDYSISAELTNIPTSSMFQHTGSGVDE